MNIEGCSAIVTGGASGLGEATARALAAAGARVAVFDLNSARGERVVAEIGGLLCVADVGNRDAVEAAFERARAFHGQERILVNCAGIGNVYKTVQRARDTGEITHFPLDEFERVVRVNLFGTFHCIAKSAAGMAALDALDTGEKGVIVNTASIAAEDGAAGQAAYAASKSAIVGLTLPVARDLKNEGIRINTILPGAFDTALFASAALRLREALIGSIPFPQRLGSPQEFASLVLEMCRNPYLNGACVRLDAALRVV